MCAAGTTNRGRCNLSPWDLTRSATVALLLFAAVAKSYQFVSGSPVGSGSFESRWMVLVAVQVELAVGAWLVTGLWPRTARLVVGLLFGCFAAVSAFKAAAGHGSCGCFGEVRVSPWVTFTLDAAVVLAVLTFARAAAVRPSVW